MRKRWKLLLAIVVLATLMAGCGGEPATGQAAPDAVCETAPAQEGTAFGREVWAVRRSDDGGGAYVVRYAVFARDGDLLAVVPMFTEDPVELRRALTEAAEAPLDGTGHLYLVSLDNCYPDQEAAQAAADKENDDGM